MAEKAPARKCRRCQKQEELYAMRAEHLCSDCYCRFVATKTVKRLEVLSKEATRRSSTPTQQHQKLGRRPRNKRFLVGLSLGASSAALVDICEQIIAGQEAKGREASFTVDVVHVRGRKSEEGKDTDAIFDRWRTRYPRFSFATCPLQRSDDNANEQDLRLDERSAASRADLQHVLVRRRLVQYAMAGGFDGLLLGSSTTALAERTLSEAAKGRGFAVPWEVQDGVARAAVDEDRQNDQDQDQDQDEKDHKEVLLYYPLRELFRKELVTYGQLTSPPLDDQLVLEANKGSTTSPSAAVVSHKNLGIDEVLKRYFADVEASYPSVVANVVKTSGKLERRGGKEEELDSTDGSCKLCAMPMDQVGNVRWQGELGEKDSADSLKRYCYGCERSLKG